MAPGPRIYNLFPLLAGTVSDWVDHLPRIAAMGFNWVYVNSFHVTGSSGSLYSVRDPYRLDRRFRDADGPSDDLQLGRFVDLARREGLGVMMDVQLAYAARDSALVAEHPGWFRRRDDGSFVFPSTTDDHGRETAWHDIAALDYARVAEETEKTEYWARYLRHYLSLGFEGFVCKSAHAVPAALWRVLIEDIRGDHRGARFIGDTVGAKIGEIEALAGARFDFILNSAAWWDFRSDWLFEQQARLRRVAPSISFPESHDTERASAHAHDAGHLEAQMKLRLAFAASLSAGWMMPIGCEYGFRNKLDVIRTRKEDWEEQRVDLSAYIAELNALKDRDPVFNTEGGVQRVTSPGQDVVGLLRLSSGHLMNSREGALVLLNPGGRAQTVALSSIYPELGGRFDRFTDVTPGRTPLPITPETILTLEPGDVRLVRGDLFDRLKQTDRESDSAIRKAAQRRVVIEAVSPEIDRGDSPAKCVAGDLVTVTADIFMDGHDQIGAAILYRAQDETEWREAPMAFVDNDRWGGRFPTARNTTYLYTIEAWRDPFASWKRDFVKKRDAGQDVQVEIKEGRDLLQEAARKAPVAERERLKEILGTDGDIALLSDELEALLRRIGPRDFRTRYGRELPIIADRLAAQFSAWYELFPRSQSGDPARHGTLDDVIARLPYVRDMGFDVLYFPPIHPIGLTNRKGRNNSLKATPDDPGSPYAIGAKEGGHTALHPALGTIADFRRLVLAAHEHGLELALDFAVQCSPDHPWIKEHPQWFDRRADGTIKFAENPPKKYEDIVNPNFYRGVPDLWLALRDVISFWIEQGVRIFRVDNPHTKPVPFWSWMISDIQERHPDVIFLSEAFTRPKMMRKLAKAGFSQSYSYFTWRNTKAELTAYLIELAQGESRHYLRPNFFTNTPDINPFFLQSGARSAFMIRAALAATLASAYGIYSGFELCEGRPLPGKEEYLDSEKYEIKAWDWDRSGNIRAYITQLNRIRRRNPALHDFRNLKFYGSSSDQVLVFGKATPDRDNVILAAVNLDPHATQSTTFEIPLWEFNLPDHTSLRVNDEFSGESWSWQGKYQQVTLDPHANPAAIWRLDARV